MKNKLKVAGLAAIPLAIIGTLAASVAFAAQPPAPSEQPAPIQASVPKVQVADTDAETNDDGAVSKPEKTGAADSDTETNDDSSGPQEAPGVEQAD